MFFRQIHIKAKLNPPKILAFVVKTMNTGDEYTPFMQPSDAQNDRKYAVKLTLIRAKRVNLIVFC